MIWFPKFSKNKTFAGSLIKRCFIILFGNKSIMNKVILILLSCCLFVFAEAQTTSLKLGNTSFTIEEVAEHNPEEERKVSLSLKRNGKQLLTHTILYNSGDHNSEELELGDYDVSDSTITFYSYWAWGGDAPIAPFGGRIQTYKIQPDGRLLFEKGEIYIEEGRAGFGGMIPEAVKFLNEESPTTQAEKKEFAKYIKNVEDIYHAKFVYGAESNKLMKAVRNRLAKRIDEYTKNWKELYKSSFGYKK